MAGIGAGASAQAGRRTLVGTCGYSYDEWRGILYPEGLPKASFLGRYAQDFPFVELDFSYYGMPKAQALAKLAAQAPPDFLFALKAHKSLTHEREAGWREKAAEFAAAAAALAEAGKLAAVLIQLPYSFKRGEDERRYLGALCDELAAFPLAVEFRNDQWQGEAVLSELARRGAALVLVDRPELPGLPPVSAAVAGTWSYLRFHGRNAEAWWTGGATGRYDYLYSQEELDAVLPLIRSVEEKAELLLVAFNNHAKGRAVVNARMLMGMLGA
jgi:uncharacterized protein YecE (DUF72 family)